MGWGLNWLRFFFGWLLIGRFAGWLGNVVCPDGSDQFWTRGLLASSRCRLPSCLVIQVSPCWASHFLLPGQEKVTKEKATPTSGFCFAKLPSLRRCSGGRREGTSLSLHSSLGVLPRVPLRNAYARPPDGGVSPRCLTDREAWFVVFDRLKTIRRLQSPLQEGERSRRGEGRAAWMPREP